MNSSTVNHKYMLFPYLPLSSSLMMSLSGSSMAQASCTAVSMTTLESTPPPPPFSYLHTTTTVTTLTSTLVSTSPFNLLKISKKTPFFLFLYKKFNHFFSYLQTHNTHQQEISKNTMFMFPFSINKKFHHH